MSRLPANRALGNKQKSYKELGCICVNVMPCWESLNFVEFVCVM